MKGDGRTRVVVVGGGASGLVAAIAAARAGASVDLLERGERVGRKLLATGNGRCNLTNLRPDPGRYHGQVAGFPAAAIARFDADRTLAFFRALGITPVAEDDGRVYPRSQQASAVLDVLRWEVDEAGVRVATDAEVRDVRPTAGGFVVKTSGGASFAADRVVLAAGGKASPSLGGTPAGLDLARSLGHAIVEPFPSLVQVRLDSRWCKGLAGTRFDGRVEVLADGATVAASDGEVLFNEYGVSGNAVFDTSRAVGESVRAGDRVVLKLSVVCDLDPDALAADVAARLDGHPQRPVSAALTGLVHKKLVPPLLRDAGIDDLARPASDLDPAARARLVRVLIDWRFDAIDTAGWAHAQVMAGGVSTAEVDPHTLASRLVPGLFLCGELLDVDGDCGGFNLQWAWSSGWVAGTSAARVDDASR